MTRPLFLVVVAALFNLAGEAHAQTTISGGATQNIDPTNAPGLGTITFSGTGGTLNVDASGLNSANSIVLSQSGGSNATISGSNAYAPQFSGVISGVGALTLNLNANITAANTYSGGTTINSVTATVGDQAAFGTGEVTLNGGTLLGTVTGPGFNNGFILGPGGGVIDSSADSPTLFGTISGSGALTLKNADGATIDGANTYTGGTIIENGDGVTIGNSRAFGTGAVTLNGGTIVLARYGINNDIVLVGAANSINGYTTGLEQLTGTVSGSGSLQQLSYVDLLGANTYSGGTTLLGHVGVGNSRAFGTGAVTLNGGTLIGEANNLTIANELLGGATLNSNGYSMTFAGELLLSGGTLYIEDTSAGANGVITLSGAVPQAGAFQMGNGTLRMGGTDLLNSGVALNMSGGTFDLNGYSQTLGAVTMTTLSGPPTLRTGAATLTAASYAGAGTLEVTPFAGTNVSVTGAANISGQNLRIQGCPASGTYTILSAASGVTGRFNPAINNQYAGYQEQLNYAADDVSLVVKDLFVASGQTANQSGVLAALNQGLTSPDLQPYISQLALLSPSQQYLAAEQMSPIALASLRSLSAAGMNAQSTTLSRRVAALQAGLGGDISDVALYDGGGGSSPFPGVLVAEGGAVPVPLSNATAGSPWAFYASGLYTAGRLDGENGGSGFQPGYGFDAIGGSLGADYRFDDHHAAGMTVQYVSGAATIDDGEGTTSSDGVRFGAYGAAWNDNWHGSLYAGTAWDSFSTSRVVPALGTTATASPDGYEVNAEATGGYDLRWNAYTITPFGAVNYDRLHVDGYSESGSGPLLTVGSSAYDSLRSTLGVKGERRYAAGGYGVTPSVTLGWVHEYADQSRALTAQFSAGGGQFTTTTADVSRDGLLAALGASVELTHNVTARFGLSGDFRGDYADHTIDASVRLKF